MAAFLTNFGNSIFEASTNEHTNSLEQFLNKFSNSTNLVNQIDPLATFDVYIKFYPSLESVIKKDEPVKPKWYETLASNATGGLYDKVKNAGGLGGLYDSLFNKKEVKAAQHASVYSEKENYLHKGEYSFIDYLAKANLIVNPQQENNQTTISPLELQLGFYVQSITVPKIKIPEGGKSTTLLGEFPLHGQFVIPDNNQLNMEILCTKLPLHERIFYPWMREVTMPYWSYTTQPYTTATITIDFSKHTDIQYIFTGCRPTQFDTIQPTQEPNATVTRQVTFVFDFMFISSKDTPIELLPAEDNNRLIASGKTIFNTVNKFI